MLAPFRGAVKSRQSIDSAAGSGGASSEGERHVVMVLPSSTELFYFYGQTLEQCAKLFTGKPLFDLATLHKKWLGIYAGWRLSYSMRSLFLTLEHVNRGCALCRN